MESNVTATLEIRLSVSAERWAAIQGLSDPYQSGTSVAGKLKEALGRINELIPELSEAGGTITVTPTKWVASGGQTA